MAGGGGAEEATEAAAPTTTATRHKIEERIDRITEVQDTVDSLSLSLFEALRGLRDAVAPEEAAARQQQLGGAGPSAMTTSTTTSTTAAASTSAGKTGTNQHHVLDDDPDYDDFLVSYHNRDPAAVNLVTKSGGTVPKTREEYVKLLARAEMEKDAELASRLAEEVLSKSEAVDVLVSRLPGMGRTKDQQMKKIMELLESNRAAAEELEGAYEEAVRRREEVREALRDVTCRALGIEEEEEEEIEEEKDKMGEQ